ALPLGSGEYPGLYVEGVVEDVLYRVCTPGLIGGRLPEGPKEMAGLPQLRGVGDPCKPWFEAPGVDWPEPRKGLLLE
ncbi:transcriptional regulator GcvA, partial [Cupriavidus necator]